MTRNNFLRYAFEHSARGRRVIFAEYFFLYLVIVSGALIFVAAPPVFDPIYTKTVGITGMGLVVFFAGVTAICAIMSWFFVFVTSSLAHSIFVWRLVSPTRAEIGAYYEKRKKDLEDTVSEMNASLKEMEGWQLV